MNILDLKVYFGFQDNFRELAAAEIMLHYLQATGSHSGSNWDRKADIIICTGQKTDIVITK